MPRTWNQRVPGGADSSAGGGGAAAGSVAVRSGPAARISRSASATTSATPNTSRATRSLTPWLSRTTAASSTSTDDATAWSSTVRACAACGWSVMPARSTAARRAPARSRALLPPPVPVFPVDVPHVGEEPGDREAGHGVLAAGGGQARRVSWAVSRGTQAAANAAGSPGGTTTPPRPAASGIPPTSVTTVGRPGHRGLDDRQRQPLRQAGLHDDVPGLERPRHR